MQLDPAPEAPRHGIRRDIRRKKKQYCVRVLTQESIRRASLGEHPKESILLVNGHAFFENPIEGYPVADRAIINRLVSYPKSGLLTVESSLLCFVFCGDGYDGLVDFVITGGCVDVIRWRVVCFAAFTL